MWGNKTVGILSIPIVFWNCLSTQTSERLQLSYIYLLQSVHSRERGVAGEMFNSIQQHVGCMLHQAGKACGSLQQLCTLTWIVWFRERWDNIRALLRTQQNVNLSCMITQHAPGMDCTIWFSGPGVHNWCWPSCHLCNPNNPPKYTYKGPTRDLRSHPYETLHL